MKFLCVPCDTPMTLRSLEPPERGSLSVVYVCPACGYEMAMLTNAYETQVVQSLGVRIGPADAARQPPTDTRPEEHAAIAVDGATAAERGAASGCPFAAMIPGAADTAPPPSIAWTAAAEARLANIPSFVRPMAKTGIEQFARERGALEVDEKILDAAKDFFGM